MPVFPKAEEKRALCEILTQYVAKGHVEKPVLQYLFQCSIEAGNNPTHISETHVLQDCPSGPPSDGAVRALISRLRHELVDFFANHAIGRQQKYQVIIPNKTYALSYDFNHPPPMAGNLIKNYWAHYYSCENPVRIFYPELTAPKQQSPDFSFTPSAIVQAVTVIFEALNQFPKTRTTATPIRPTDPFPNQDEDVIILGSYSGMPQIVQFEATYPLQSGSKSITFNNDEKTTSYSDQTSKRTPVFPKSFKVWALVSRTPRLFEGRVATTLSCSNYKAFPALASFLTRQPELEMLAKLFKSELFPRHFQVLFEISLIATENDELVHHLRPIIGVDLLFPASPHYLSL